MAVLTRIKNNQITDGTITGTKMVDNTITSNLFAANLTLASNITVLGNFQVAGTPTSINSINTYINDPLVVYNNGYAGSLSGYDIGILINRNLAPLTPYGSVNTAFVWVEDDQSFEAIATTETGAGIASINMSGFANVKAGNVTFETVRTGGLQSVAIGNVTPGTGVFTTGTFNTITTGGLQSVAIGNVTPGFARFTTVETSDTIKSLGNIVAYSGTDSTSTTTGAMVVKGGLGVTGNINSGSKWNYLTAIQDTIIGNVTASQGLFTQIGSTTTANLNTVTAASLQSLAIGNVTPGTGVFTSGTFNTISTGGLQAVAIGNVTPGTGNFTTVTIGGLASSNIVITGGSINNTPIGNVTTASGAFTTLDSSGITRVTNSTNATATGTGAFQVTAGGASILKDLWVGGNIYAANILATTTNMVTIQDPLIYLQALGNLSTYNYDVGFFSDYTQGGYRHTGLARDYNTAQWGFFSNVASEPVPAGVPWTDAGLAWDTVKLGELIVANTTISTSNTTGALRVAGGAGIVGKVYTGDTITAGGNIVAASGTDSTSVTTGALVVTGTGGAGIGGQLRVGGNVATTGAALTTANTTAYLFNESATTLNVGKAATTINVGADSGTITIGNPTLVGTQTTQNVYNTTATTVNAFGAATALNMGASTGTATINNVTLTLPNATAVNVNGASPTIATTSTGTVTLFNTAAATVNAFGAATTIGIGNSGGTTTVQGIVKLPSGNLVAASGTNSTSTTTGAVVVTAGGGLGVTGNVFLGNSVIMNSSQTANQDVIIRGKNDATLLWARPSATYDQIIVGASSTTANLVTGAKFAVNSIDSMLIPVGPNSGRPSSLGYTDVPGMFRFNTTIGSIEWYNGTAWGTASTNFTLIVEDQFNGDGSTTDFTLSVASTTASSIVAINGIVQAGGSSYAYTVVGGTTLRFSQAPAVGDLIDVRILTTTQQVVGLSSTAGFVQINVDDNAGITFVAGTSGTAVVGYMPIGGGWVDSMANVSVASANTATTVDTVSTTTYRSAKYKVQVKNGTNYQVSEALVIHNGTTAYISEYGSIQTNGNLGVLSATVSGSNVLVQFIAANSTNTVRISREYLPI
jgi:hypothetical protein